jgi:uncharacterized membrane protein YvlD (DUF360 family)
MWSEVLTILVNALLFRFLFPSLKGFTFTGSFGRAILYAIGLEFVGILLGLALVFFSLATLGLGLLVLVPCIFFGFWLVNAILLKILASWFPTYLSIQGWWPAILAGLILFVVDALFSTDSYVHVQLNL